MGITGIFVSHVFRRPIPSPRRSPGIGRLSRNALYWYCVGRFTRYGAEELCRASRNAVTPLVRCSGDSFLQGIGLIAAIVSP